MTYIVWDVSPILIDLGFFAIRWYSVFFALGFVFSYFILSGQFKGAGLDPKHLDRLTTYVVLATVIGARLAHCLFYEWSYYSDHIIEIFLPVRFNPEFEFIGFQGLASHGGILGVAIALLLFTRKYSVDVWWLFDRLAIVGALAGVCIRLGNLMNSEIIGKPSEVAWAFIFSRIDDVPRHPGQLYEALAYLGIFALLLSIDKNSNRRPGFLFGLFFALLFISRFLIEFVKADQSTFEAGMLLNMGQLLSIPFIILGISLMVVRRNRPG